MKDAPDVIWLDEKIGSNGYHGLDYKNTDDDIEYIRKAVVDKLIVEICDKEYSKIECMLMVRDTTKHIRAAMEEYENEKDLSDTDAYYDAYYLELFKQAIRADVEGK